MPAPVAEAIMEHMKVPVIGIGAGPCTDGQVLVFHDMLGVQDAIQPKFVKRYAHVRASMVEGTRAFAAEVRHRSFPAPEHSYAMAPEELERFRAHTTAPA